MKRPYRLSVITPVFNGIRFIESCILNVIEQDCPQAEHIIVDGGSTDGTVEVIKHYADIYGHIQWISEQDKGQSDAMNKGIRMAQGDILGFLNVDDFYEPSVLCRIIELFTTLPAPSLLVGNSYRWNNKNEIYKMNKPAKLDITDLMLGWDVNPFPVNPSQYFYHKSLHQRIGLYNLDEHYTLDIDFLIRAVQVAHVNYRNEFWGNYRFIEGTKTFQDIQNKMCDKRFKDLLHKHKSKLPIRQRFLISLKQVILVCTHLMNRLRFFIKNPAVFLKKLRFKIIRSFYYWK